jgi:hypothetical protein
MTLASPQIIQKGNNFHVQHGTDAGLFVQFYMEALKDEEATVKEGRPIFVDREFIKIIPVGDKNTVVCRPVRLTWEGNNAPDNERWPQQYAAFKNQQIQVNEGTPLEHWSPLTKSQVMSLKAVNVHTVEQLAAVSDGNLHNLGMGARELREKAIFFINSSKDASFSMAAQKEIEELKKQVEALKNQLQGFGNANKENDSPKKRGRPPANKEELNG